MSVRRGQRGNIAAVLLTTVVALALLFTMAAGAVSQLRLTSHSNNALQARAMAEAAIATVTAHLRKDLSFGQTSGLLPNMPAAEIRVAHDQAVGLLSFHEDRAEELKIPLSINNVDSDATAAGWEGRTIPPEAAQLVAVGTCGDVSRTVEVVLHVPRFPYVVSSSGEFTSSGPMVLGVLPESADPAHFSVDDLLPGHLASNDKVNVGGQAVISGDIEAVDSISLVDPATVRGLLKPNSAPVPLAQIRIADYQPNPAITDIFGGSSEHTDLAGFYQGSGLVTANGGLDLQGAVLYVDGDIEINGPLTGKGAVISTGTIKVNGTTTLTSDQQVALLSHGDVTLNGHGSFSGLVYTEGNLHSTGVKLIGALIANSSSGGAIELNDTGALVGIPSLNFDEGWLYEPLEDQVTLPWHAALGGGGLNKVKRRGTVTPEGDHFVVEWTFEGDDPTSAMASALIGNGFLQEVHDTIGPFPTVREVYDSDGQRVSSNYDEVYPPFWEQYQQLLESHAQWWVDDGTGGHGVVDTAGMSAGTPFNPPLVAPKRLAAEPILQTFKLDFNQFLRPEENLRLLLRVDH